MYKLKVCNFTPTETEIIIDKPLSNTQIKYYKAIEKYKLEYHKVPSIRKIGELVNVNSPATVLGALRRMEEKGYDYRIMKY